MEPGKFCFLAELKEELRKKEHRKSFENYATQLTLFDKTRLTKVRTPGWISWFVWGDRTWRDPFRDAGVPHWVKEEFLRKGQ